FLADEMHRGVIRLEIVWHGFDGCFDFSLVGSRFRYHIANPLMAFGGGEAGRSAGPHLLNGTFERYRVLYAVFHAGHPPYRVRMPLAKTFPPERVFFALRQDA